MEKLRSELGGPATFPFIVPIFRVPMGASTRKKGGAQVSIPGAASRVRVISPGGVYLGRVPMERAHELIREKLAKGIGGKGKQEFRTLQMLQSQVASRIPGGKSVVYNEDLGDHHHVLTLMRPTRGGRGEYVRWHPELSFQDLRENRLKPAKTRAA